MTQVWVCRRMRSLRDMIAADKLTPGEQHVGLTTNNPGTNVGPILLANWQIFLRQMFAQMYLLLAI